MTVQLDFDADTIVGAMDYFTQRDYQLAETGWRLKLCASLLDDEPWGVLARFEKDGEKRFAVYVLASRRGEGKLSEFVVNNPTFNFITVDDCNVAGFYAKHNRDCLVLEVPQSCESD